ncbi:MAG: glycosyltransferase [Anaerolineae bacterium]
MRVLCITTNFPRWEGDPHSPWIVQMIRLLHERGVDVEVLAPSYQGLGNHVIYSIPVFRYRYFFSPWETLTHTEGAPNKIKNPLYLPLIAPYMLSGAVATAALCRRQKYDVIHVHWPLPQGVFGLVGKRLSGARLVASFHGAELLLTRRYPFLKPVLRYIVERCDAVSANSSFTAGLIREVADVDVQVIPYGSSIEAPVKKEAPPLSADARPQILFVGRLIERKGLPYLIEAMDCLSDRILARLDIVGLGYQEPELKRMVKERGLEEVVIFRGRVTDEELNELYANCQVFVLPSIIDAHGDTEGLGVVLLEALSYKKPVIGTNVGGIPDIILPGETGVLVEPGDAVALAEAIERVLSDPAWARRLGEAGYAYVSERFAWPRIVDDIMALYSPESETPSHDCHHFP